MARQTLKLDHIKVYRFRSDTKPEIIKSFAELILDQHLGDHLDLVLHDELGQEVIITIHNAEYSILPIWVTGIDCHRPNGLIEFPTTPPPPESGIK